MNAASSVSRQAIGSLDGSGAGDHDVAYRFGRLPTASSPFPFSTRQFARLLILRGRVRQELNRTTVMRGNQL
jgi:hypothetical protein